MRSYLIDPQARTIKTIDYDPEKSNIAKLIGCDTFDAARFNVNGDVVYVDDEGLLHEPVYQFFGIRGYPQPLAGKGLVLGCDDMGETQAPSVDIEWLKSNGLWIERLVGKAWSISPIDRRRKARLATIDEITDLLSEVCS